jgi:hypothetical protein
MPRSLALRALCSCMAFGAVIACAPDAPAQPGASPLVFMESDPDGARYLRVMEPARAGVATSRSIQNLPSSGRINIRDATATLVRDVTIRNARYGVYVANASPASIENLAFLDWDGGDSIHGAAIKLDRSGPAPTYIQRVFANGMEGPDASYRRSNTDFIGIERSAGPVFVRYATGRNFGDGGVDAKSDAALMNVTIDGAHRGLRAWSNVTITIADAIINVPAGHDQVWLQDATSQVRYHNVLWCVGAETPSPDARECSTRPTAISGDNISEGQARQQVVALSSNPLPEMDPFFATQIDRIVIEYSSDGGANWREMASSGSRGHPPLGDTRFRVPLNLSSGTYLFRAYFERNGARVGSITTVNEDGQSVSA